ncbi:MAG: S26 family signal peptidase [Pirellulales bacterium]|nr:S26 family signal peptidase [Pirellulales bacterium]
MPRIDSFRTILYLSIGSVLLAFVLRTWLVMGLIEPVIVSGSSMAPGLRGAYVTAECPECGAAVDVAAEYVARGRCATCSQCGLAKVPLAALPRKRGDRLWIDRTAYIRRQPRRWETVVLRAPHDTNQLCVKRVVGLPGETVELRDGDVWIKGQVATKLLADQRALRLPIHCDENLLTDDLPYNAGLSRSLELVRDFMLSARLRMAGPGSVVLEINDGRLAHRVTLIQPGGVIELRENDTLVRKLRLSSLSRQRLEHDEVDLEISNFDRQWLLAIDGRQELSFPIQDMSPPAGVAKPFTVETHGFDVTLRELKQYRDVFYGRQPVGTHRPPAPAILLGEEEYFLLGDNAPISLDSRNWGAVSAKLFLGSPIAVR